ncbi:MAG: sulfotransferase [Hellea sp.]|nr:sulfotransferase [Hellea sp.]
MKPNLIFLCGALRSGSTLTHLMLDSHPMLKNPGEFDFLFDQLTDNGRFPEVAAYREWLSTHRIFQSKNLSVDETLPFFELIKSFIKQLTEPGKVLVLNVHRGFNRIPYLFPDAGYIHLIRDPRDVARSSIGMGWAGNVYYGVEHWIETERSWKSLVSRIKPEEYIEMRFEDLILSSVEELRKVCDFLKIHYSEEMFNYVDGSTYSKPNSELVSQWKRKLSTREIQYVEEKSHRLMTELDYRLYDNSIITLGFIERKWLWINNKIFIWKFSIKRYGLVLEGSRVLSQFLGLATLNKRIRLEINKIDEQYLK